MEVEERPIISDEAINRKSGVEKNDVYHIINTCREHEEAITPDQAAVFLARVREESNRALFLSDVGKHLHKLDAEGMKKMVTACRHNKSKREVVVNLAEFLPENVTDEEKEEICALITSGFERNKAKQALGI